LKNNSAIKTSELRITEKVPGKLTSAPFESLGSFKMYKLQEIAWNNSQSLFTTGSGNFHIIFCHEEFDLFKPINIKNDQVRIYKIMFGSERQVLVSELDSKNLSGYYCIFDENFSSLIGDPSCPPPFFSPIKHRNECIINVPADRIERFNLIFDLIYSLFESSTEHKAILIASYLLVVLKEADIIFRQLYQINNSSRRTSADIITRRFKDLIAKHYLQKQTVRAYAEMLCITPDHLNKIVKTTAGKTALELIKDRILADAKALLHYSTMNISEIAYSLGFENSSYFTRLFRKKIGVAPFKYRNQMIESI
jgi:AraC-like DNA-binding protein